MAAPPPLALSRIPPATQANQHATKRSLLVEKQKDFSDQKCVDSQSEKCLSGVTKLHGHQTESYFLRFALGRLISITGHFIGIEKSINCVGSLSFRRGKESFGFNKLLELVWTLVYFFHRSMK